MRILVVLLFTTLSIFAQPPGVLTGSARPANPQTMLTATADTLLADPAERSTIASTAELKFKRGWQEVIKPSFTLRNEYYDFDGSVFDAEFDAPDEATHAELGLAYLRFTESGWSFFSKAELGFAAEDSADMTDDPTGLVILGAGRLLGKTRNKLGLGIITKRDVEESWRFFPVPTIELHFADHWSFATERGLAVKRDAGGPTRFGLGIDYLNSRFRTAAGQVLEYNAAPVYLNVEHDASESLTLSGRLGVSAWGELELDDENGRGIEDEDLDSGFHAALQAKWKF